MGTYVMSLEFIAAGRSFCEVEPTTLFAGPHQEPSWRGSSPRTIAEASYWDKVVRSRRRKAVAGGVRDSHADGNDRALCEQPRLRQRMLHRQLGEAEISGLERQ